MVTVMLAFAPVDVHGAQDNLPAEDMQTVSREYILTSDYDLTAMEIPEHVKTVEYADKTMALIKIDREANLNQVCEALIGQFPDLQIQPNFVYEKSAINDPYFSSQWGLRNDETSVDIDFEEAYAFIHSKRAAMKETTVAVIDTGMDTTHGDLEANIWKNDGEIAGNGRDDDKNGYTDDVSGYDFHNDSPLITDGFTSEYNHGTHCGGIIGAVSGNYKGITGIGSITGTLSLMNLKTLGKDGTGDSFSVVRAIKYAEKNGADICNLSLSSYEDDALLHRTIAESDMLFVCAAGNDGLNLNEYPTYPGCCNLDNVICVSNMNSSGTLYRLSNYSSRYADIAAPGTGIYSTVTGNSYKKMTGTSMAAPFVSGVAALLHSYYDGITAEQMRELILSKATRSDLLSGKVAVSGYLNAYRPLIAYPRDTFVPDVTAPNLDITVSEISGSYKQKMTVTASDDSGITPMVRYARGSHTKSYFRGGKGYDVDLNEQNTGSKSMGVPGPYTVYAADESGNDVVYTVTCTADAVKSIKLNYTKKTLYRGSSFTLKASLSKSGKYGRTLSYTSSNKAVAAVSSGGRVTAKKRGTAYITVKTGNLLTAKCKVTVK